MAYVTEDRLSSSVKFGPLTLLQGAKIFRDPKGKVRYFNITVDGKLQCFEDEEVKIFIYLYLIVIIMSRCSTQN